MNSRHIEVIYCDDIRHEVSGKLSFMGVYHSEMIVPNFPITLPKFCIHLSIVTPISQPFKKLSITITKNDEEITEMPIHDETLQDIIDNTPLDDENLTMTAIRAGFNFTPLLIEEPCRIRVSANTENEEIKGFALNIKQHKSQD